MSLTRLQTAALILAAGLGLDSPASARTQFSDLGTGEPDSTQGGHSPHPNFIVNRATGNVLFRLGTFGFDRARHAPTPPIQIYFNTLATAQAGDFTGGMGLGAGWSSTVGARIEFPSSTTATVTLGDGSAHRFALVGGLWQPREGGHWDLEQSGPEWVLRDVRRQEMIFDAAGTLDRIASATGHVYSIQRVGSTVVSTTDPIDRVITLVHANGRLDSISSGGATGASFDYDAQGRLNKVSSPNVGELILTYDASDRVRTLEDPGHHVWTFDYVATGAYSGRVERIIDPAGHDEWFTYSTAGGFDVTQQIDARGNAWEFTYQPGWKPLLVREENPLGHAWTQGYDSDRRLTSLRAPMGNRGAAKYDSEGMPQVIRSATGTIRRYTYDGIGNLTSVTFDGARTDYRYESALYPTRLTHIEMPPDVNGVRGLSTYSYYGPSDGPTPGRWSGLPSSLTDPNGVETRFEYDDNGFLAAIHEGPVGAAGRIELRYDQGPLGAYVDHGGMQYPSQFPDVPGLPWQVSGRIEQLQAGSASRDWRGSVTSSTFDIDAPIASGSGSESSQLVRSATYDYRGRLTLDSHSSSEVFAHVTSPPATTPTRSFVTTFDDDDPEWVTQTLTPDGDTIEIRRDAAGRVSNVLLTGPHGNSLGSTIFRELDGEVRLVTRTDGSATGIEYDTGRRVERVVHLSGSNEILSIVTQFGSRDLPVLVTETSARGVLTRAYEYDDRRRLVRESIEETNGVVTEHAYAFDVGNNRIAHQISVDCCVVESATYHYDLEDPATYQSANNRLMWIEFFDGSGAATATRWYRYDNPFGHVSHVIDADAGATTFDATVFVYGVTGSPWLSWNSSWQDTGSGPNSVVRGKVIEVRQLGARRRLWRERDPVTFAPVAGEWVTRSGALGASYSVDPSNGTLSPMHLDGDSLGRLSATGSQAVLSDRLGNVRLSVMGSIVPSAESTAFGLVTGVAPPSHLGFAGGLGPRRHPGAGALAGEGLIAMGHRNYSPRSGRFLMRDPLGLAGGFNLYAFAGNGPTYSVDPSGLAGDSWFDAAFDFFFSPGQHVEPLSPSMNPNPIAPTPQPVELVPLEGGPTQRIPLVPTPPQPPPAPQSPMPDSPSPPDTGAPSPPSPEIRPWLEFLFPGTFGWGTFGPTDYPPFNSSYHVLILFFPVGAGF